MTDKIAEFVENPQMQDSGIFRNFLQDGEASGRRVYTACHTQQAIAEAVGVTRQAVAVWEEEFAKKSAADNFAKPHDFNPPIYNVQQAP